MDWLAKYWWILVLVFLVGVLLNVIKDLKRVDHKKFLANKPDLPPHRDFNDKWDDDDDWPKRRSSRRRSFSVQGRPARRPLFYGARSHTNSSQYRHRSACRR